jgi:predicted ATPase/class 3 adenylate cyclase
MAAAPSGTVTFLFTDIEGSTRLWEMSPESMAAALMRHDQIVREVIEGESGYVFKTVGDAFCAAFHTAPAALKAAISVQRAVAREPWPQTATVRVRIALHTGACELRKNDYFGRPLNRVSRLLSAGHGGQILVSAATRQLVHDSLPDHVSLRSLGEHRLRDLGSPEPVFQVVAPELANAFPPLKSLDNPELPNNLPRQLTSFIGREREIAEVGRLLEKTGLLTLTGSGGCGKSRLALQTGAEALDAFSEGVWLVELAPFADGSRVATAIAQALGISERVGQTIEQNLVQHLKDKRLLLLLDNCEHVLSDTARLTASILRNCPGVKILATSREPLGIAGEQTFRVPSLSLPIAKTRLSVALASDSEAVRLFTERAQLVKNDFTLTQENAKVLVQVCSRLDGIPLAIELASARVRSMPLEEIDNRLDKCFRLLVGGDRSGLPRHQTLRALVDWSYELLSESEKRLLRKLSVFAGGWTLQAAEKLGEDGEIESWEVLDLLTSLTDKSLVIADDESGQFRYRLLETVRQYGAEKLLETGEAAEVRSKHAQIYLALAEEAEPHLKGRDQDAWLNRLEREHDNLRAALGYLSQSDSWPEADFELRLAGALHRFWSIRGYLSEGREHLAGALKRSERNGISEARGDAFLGLGRLAWFQGDFTASRPLFEEGLAIQRKLENRSGVAYSLVNLANVANNQGDYEGAKRMNEESLAFFRELGDDFGIASALGNLGNVASDQGDYDAAWPLYEECRLIQKRLGNKYGLAIATHNLGLAAYIRRDYDVARTLFEEVLEAYRELSYKSGTASMLANLGNVALRQGNSKQAQTLFEECLSLRRDLGDQKGIASGLEEMGQALAMQSHFERAAQIWGAASEIRKSFGMVLTSSERAQLDKEVNDARSKLGPESFEAAWNMGAKLTWEQAVDVALATTDA